MTVLESIAKRHAVRAFTTERVDDHAIRTLLAAAVRAPTAMHAEPWVFVVVQDRALLKKYSELAKTSPRSGGDAARALAAPHQSSDDHAAAILAQPSSTSSTTPERSS